MGSAIFPSGSTQSVTDYDPNTTHLPVRDDFILSATWLSLQGGMEFEYYFSNRYFGGVFSAVNASAYQSNAFAPNFSTTMGYIFPQDRGKRRVRIGLNYYNGRALSNQFQNKKEKFIAFIVALDV